jgi:hypothetical protein
MKKLGLATVLAATLLASEADAGSFCVWGEVAGRTKRSPSTSGGTSSATAHPAVWKAASPLAGSSRPAKIT